MREGRVVQTAEFFQVVFRQLYDMLHIADLQLVIKKNSYKPQQSDKSHFINIGILIILFLLKFDP